MTTKSLVLEHCDAYTVIYDHKPVAVEIKGSMTSRKAIEKLPRLDKRWIQTRVEEELNQAVQYTKWQAVLHWTLDQHEHRHELTTIIHEATEEVSAKKIKPMKPYVTDEILEVSAHRTLFIKTISREEKYARLLDKKLVINAWKEVSQWIAGHRRPTREPLDNFREFKSCICHGDTRY